MNKRLQISAYHTFVQMSSFYTHLEKFYDYSCLYWCCQSAVSVCVQTVYGEIKRNVNKTYADFKNKLLMSEREMTLLQQISTLADTHTYTTLFEQKRE